MTSTNEKVLVIGATGNIGSKVVKELLAKNVAVTAYVRDTDKAAKSFANLSGSLTLVQGDYSDLAPLEKALPGHTRLFLMVIGLKHLVSVKSSIATLAYAAGVKQIVDLSGSTFNQSPRAHQITRVHEQGELAILNIPNRGRAVTLRPSRFMSNVFRHNAPGFTEYDDFVAPDTLQAWISPNDIAAVAAVVLTGSIEDHDDNVYELTSQVATPTELVQALTRVTGRTITYKQVSALDRFNAMKFMISEQFPFGAIYDLATLQENNPQVSLGISILLGRDPETLDAYFNGEKQKLVV